MGVTDENINAPNFDFYIGEDQVQNIPEGTLQEDDEDKSIVKLRIVLFHFFGRIFSDWNDFNILGRNETFPISNMVYSGSSQPEVLDRKSPTGTPDGENWKGQLI